MNKIAQFVGLILLLCGSEAYSAPELRAYLSTSYLLRGESAELIIESTQKAKMAPQVPAVKGYRVRLNQAFATRNARREVIYQYRYRLLSFELGEQRIPPITVEFSGKFLETPPLSFMVLDPAELNFQTIQIGENAVDLATEIFLPSRDLFLGETVPAEIKVYLPYDSRILTVVDRGLPEIERDGVSVWRFHPDSTPNLQPFLLPNGQYIALTYRSSAYAIREGQLTLGPGHVRPVFSAPVARRGFNSWANLPVKLPLSATTARAIALPQPSPPRYNGAVGQFSLQAKVANPVRSSPRDPVTVELTVTGSGNLDSLGVPMPDAQEADWKLYPATKAERASERRYLSGEVLFTQIMRPTVDTQTVPAFELVYFDPASQKYEIARTDPIPLFERAIADLQSPRSQEQDPLSAPPGEQSSPGETLSTSESSSLIPTPVPREAMTGFLGFVDPQRAQEPTSPSPFSLYWYWIPAATALLLICLLLSRFLGPLLRKSPEERSRRDEWQHLRTLQAESTFYQAAARYGTRWLAEEDPYLTQLTAKRDTLAYRAVKSKEPIAAEDKKAVLSELNKRRLKSSHRTHSSMLLITLLLSAALSFPLEASVGEYPDPVTAEQNGELPQYLSLLTTQNNTEDLPPDTLYNIGVAYSKLEQPGQAALYFHRTLQKAPRHAEALQNLRYLQRVFGSIVIERRGLKLLLSHLSSTLVSTIFYLHLWLILLLVLGLLLLLKRKGQLIVKGGLVGALLLLPVTALAFFLYPNDGQFCPSEALAVITADQTITARTAAASSASEVIKVPPGSLCRVLDRRGLWAYLEFANGTRGWLSTKHLDMVAPQSPYLTPLPPLDSQELLN